MKTTSKAMLARADEYSMKKARQQHQLMAILQKIPVLEGLSPEQSERLIRICRFQKYATDTQIYTAGDASEDFLVLIVGKLTVLSPAGQKLGELSPGVSIGEMGVFSGHVRSATVVAIGDCAGLVITRDMINQLMDGDHSIKATIMANVVKELSTRLAEANGRADSLMSAVQKHEADAAAAQEGRHLASGRSGCSSWALFSFCIRQPCRDWVPVCVSSRTGWWSWV